MMVLRHLGPPSATIVSHEDISQEDDGLPIPIDLSNKHVHPTSQEIPRHLSSRSPFLSIITPTTIQPLSTAIANHNNNNTINNNNNNNDIIKCNSSRSTYIQENIPTHLLQQRGEIRRSRKRTSNNNNNGGELSWRESDLLVQSKNEDSSPDSGLHRDSMGEDEDKAITPPLSIRHQRFIPLSTIRSFTPNNSRVEGVQQGVSHEESENSSSRPVKGGRAPDKVLKKRGRLEKVVTNIKSSKDRSRRNSGEDDTSSGGHFTSSDAEVAEDAPTDLRNSSFRQRIVTTKENGGGCLNIKQENLAEDDILDEDEPCNLVCPKKRSKLNGADSTHLNAWANNNSTSPTEAAKMFGMDQETFQSHMLNYQLQSANNMLGEPGGIINPIVPYPQQPNLLFFNLYTQLIQSYRAQEMLRSYAMQSNPVTSNISQGDKSPSVPRTLGSSGYNCQSPSSPSLSEGPAGVDSDGSMVGQSTSANVNNGKRAPRAMTGRHVRTGTGASLEILKTLRLKIQERMRKRDQLKRNDLLNQPNTKIKSNNNKHMKKPSNKK